MIMVKRMATAPKSKIRALAWVENAPTRTGPRLMSRGSRRSTTPATAEASGPRRMVAPRRGSRPFRIGDSLEINRVADIDLTKNVDGDGHDPHFARVESARLSGEFNSDPCATARRFDAKTRPRWASAIFYQREPEPYRFVSAASEEGPL